VRRGLSGSGTGPARVLLLAQAWWGWGDEPPARAAGLRALFVRPRGRAVAPPWAAACARWAAAEAGDVPGALRALQEVLL
jgi:hypothetical protein